MRARRLLVVAIVGHVLAAGAAERAYVTNEKAGTVSVIDVATRAVVATIPVGGRPRGIHAAPDGRTVHEAISRP